MSTLATADLGQSDDEADGDFVLPAKEKRVRGAKRARGQAGGGGDSDSDYSSDSEDEDGEDNDDEVKRLKAEAEQAEASDRKKRAAEAFRAMQEEAKVPSVAAAKEKEPEVEMVQVRRPRRFAGETVYEMIMLPKDHPDAKKYAVEEEEGPAANGEASTVATPSSSEAGTPVSIDSAPSSSRPSGPPLRRPMRKRPRQSLEAMAAAIDAGKKLTTLEKSQMDWNSHMSNETKLADEVAQHRRSGGYLEKQAFLDRVGDRRDAARDATESSRRRK